jgi:hypothetical protein
VLQRRALIEAALPPWHLPLKLRLKKGRYRGNNPVSHSPRWFSDQNRLSCYREDLQELEKECAELLDVLDDLTILRRLTLAMTL